MEYQEKIEQLKLYRLLDAKIESLTEEMQMWKARATKITSAISPEPKSHGSGNQMLLCIDRICEIEEEIAESTIKLQQRKHQIEEAINSLEDAAERDVLWYRYIKGFTFEKIAVKMNYSWRHIFRKHKQAIAKLNLKKMA